MKQQNRERGRKEGTEKEGEEKIRCAQRLGIIHRSSEKKNKKTHTKHEGGAASSSELIGE
jgi:hypothetical protein